MLSSSTAVSKKKTWSEHERLQLLLSYRVGASLSDISIALNRSMKSIERALNRFNVIRSSKIYRKNNKKSYTVCDLQDLFQTLGLVNDPVLNKGFFIQDAFGNDIYQPDTIAQKVLQGMHIDLSVPWELKRTKLTNVKLCKAQKSQEYNMNDLIRFMHQIGQHVEIVANEGDFYFIFMGKRHTPSTLLYFANRIRVQKGLERMFVSGITQY